MALGDSYATLTELKTRLDIGDTTDDDRLTASLSSVSREIEAWCGRQFNKTTAATARLFRARGGPLAVDDFHTTADLEVATDPAGTGSFGTVWAATDYQLEPLNGVVSGQSGWPWWRIRAVGTRTFPVDCVRPLVRVTAQWGWAAVPAPVKEACLILAAETFKAGDAPFGVAGFGEFGAVRIRDNPLARAKLAPYRLNPIRVG